jgi:putative endonuclease
MSRKSGQWHEAIAEKYLVQQGLKPVVKNFHAFRGEIDLIMLDQHSLVFVEVRFRKNTFFGSAAESVTRKKQLHLAHAAQRFLQLHPKMFDKACRFDVIAITGSANFADPPKIDWIKNAFLIT